MAIFITGDIHGDPTRLNTDCFPEQRELTKNDYVIILGDFGLVWDYRGESKQEKYWLNWLKNKPFTTLFVEGNHDCHDRLDAMPVAKWHGGKVHMLNDSVIHLCRGQVFDIDEKRFFTFGGAASHDISDGLLYPFADEKSICGAKTLHVIDEKYQTTVPMWSFPESDEGRMAMNKKYKDMDACGALFRIRGVSWWDREMPSKEEMEEGLENLSRCGNKVDYILTHSPDTFTLRQLDPGAHLYKPDILTDYLHHVKQVTEYTQHLFGHMHINRNFYKSACLYEQICQLCGTKNREQEYQYTRE